MWERWVEASKGSVLLVFAWIRRHTSERRLEDS
jgi:hypothetical protein